MQLVKKLHNVNEGLKKFAHVNKKAFEQYNNFTKQRDQLIQRREDLDKSAESIEELVEVLDQRKDEAIERTFKQVASNFEEVFEKTRTDAALGAGIFHRGEYTVKQVKDYLGEKGLVVRHFEGDL